MIVDPTKVSFTDLTGQERVGVINRNTQEKVSNNITRSIKSLNLRSLMCFLFFFLASSETVSHVEEPSSLAGGSPSLQRPTHMGTPSH